MRHVVVIPGGSANGRRVAGLMLQGFRAQGQAARLLEGPGEVEPTEYPWFYGIKEDTAPVLARARQRLMAWFYVDNPYFGRGEHWRITARAEQPSAMDWRAVAWTAPPTVAPPPAARRHLPAGIAVAPWRTRRESDVVLLCCQSPLWYALRGTTLEAWVAATSAAIASHTRRAIVVRGKPKDVNRPDEQRERPLAEDLARAAVVLSWSSNAGVEAILAGVPAIATVPCAVTPMSYTDGQGRGRLDHVETPREPGVAERLDWAAWLAANQWSADDLAAGAFWKQMRELV